MTSVTRLAALLVAMASLILVGSWPVAAAGAPVRLSATVSYEEIGLWDAAKLNGILTKDAPAFFGIDVAYSPAVNAVRLYRVTYGSVVPEKDNQPITATGLLAVPDTGGKSFPMLSYQHGTVYGKEQVPSFPDQSTETQLALAQFAGQGYVVIGADYFGMGASTEPEGYVVKASQQQAPFDMLQASNAVLDHLGIKTTRLFLGGWSQGGYVTMAFLEKLEQSGIKVDAAATASAPVDVYALLSGNLDFPRENDATWMPTIFILAAFSYENYYGVPGLARSLIKDEYYEAARKLYEREPVEAKDIPTKVSELVRDDYFDPTFFGRSVLGRLAAGNDVYRWIIRTPVHNYYGEADEAIPVNLGRLAMTYQQAIGSGNTAVEAISTGATSHRGTYARSVPLWKSWFDGL